MSESQGGFAGLLLEGEEVRTRSDMGGQDPRMGFCLTRTVDGQVYESEVAWDPMTGDFSFNDQIPALRASLLRAIAVGVPAKVA